MPNTALLIIDMINDFQFGHGPILADQCKTIIPAILKLKKQARREGFPIIYINDHYNMWQADLNRIVTHCRNDVSDELLSQILPEHDDYFLIKPHYSAFYETPLNSLLGHLQIQSLILTGIAGNICVLFTANDAHMRNYKLYVPRDCIASNCERDNQHALQIMKHTLQATILPLSDLGSLPK